MLHDVSQQLQHQLVQLAIDARNRAYAPYSRFAVGAALVTPDGSIYQGVNIENVSLGLTMCAERVAVGTAVAAGKRQFVGLALASSTGATPCGACRQVLAEFCDDLPIFLVDVDRPDQVTITSLEALLPGVFKADLAGPLASDPRLPAGNGNPESDLHEPEA